MHVSIPIQGPQQARMDLNVYQQLFFEELDTLWEPGAQVWDAYEEKYFDLIALLFRMIQDYPVYGYQSCQCVHGYNGCVKCAKDTTSEYLKGSRKIMYMGHRRWLLMDEEWREEKELFDNTVKKHGPPLVTTGEEIFELVAKLSDVKARKKQSPIKHDGMFKRKCVFWDLPYWKYLDTRHCIDVMHFKKKISPKAC